MHGKVVFGLVRRNFVVTPGYGLNQCPPFFSDLNINDCDTEACPANFVEVTTGKAGSCNPGIGDM